MTTRLLTGGSMCLIAFAGVTACGADPGGEPTALVTTDGTVAPTPPAPTSRTSPTSSAPSRTVGSTTDEPTEPPATVAVSTIPETAAPEVELPEGVLVAVPTQNREDPAKNQFQVQIHNGTRERYDISGVQFAWEGYTTPMTERDSIVVGGQVIDFPVPFPGATCIGDGSADEMPSLDAARVVLLLDDGSEVEVPVVDQWQLARRLYLDDCEKQMIESMVTIEWVELHEEDFDGRPVTAGQLRLTRRNARGDITVLSVGNTIPYEFDAIDPDVGGSVGEPVATLAATDDVTSVPIRFLESRCDPHALAEVKQPTRFVAQLDLGDGVERAYIVYPERSYWNQMRLTADKACLMLGEIEFVGDE